MPAIIPRTPRRSIVAAWAFLALLNLSAGAVIATWPERQADLDTMHRWGGEWLVRGGNIYETADDAPDYPPHAILLLSPLGALPMHLAVPLWAAINLALAPLAAFLALKFARPGLRLADAAMPMCMFLCWGGFRALLQFSLLALVFGLLSIVLAGRRPVIAGLLLGLSLMKPQIAVPFFLWAVFTRRFVMVGTALSVVIGGVAAYCLSVDYSPVQFVGRYATILRTFYATDAIMIGLAQLRPLVMLISSSAVVVDLIVLGLASAGIIAICRVGIGEGKTGRALTFAAPAMVAVWSLLTFYHLTYGFLLLLPVATLVLFLDDPGSFRFRRGLFWALQLCLMFDVVTIWRWFGPALGISAVAARFVLHADRVLMLALFGALFLLYTRTHERGEERVIEH